MTLFEYYLQYMGEICEGTRPAPAGMTLRGQDAAERAVELQRQITDLPAFVRACAASDGTEIPASVYADFSMEDVLSAAQMMVDQGENAQESDESSDAPDPEEAAPDPDAGKHAFEVFADCVSLDDGLVAYLAKVLREKDWKEFYKLSQITTKLDLDPEEFLLWLGNKELYTPEEEQQCVAVMDGCMNRLKEEKQLEVLAALLSGDQATFELFRCEAPELIHLPQATFEWYVRNYLDRDYPLRTILRFNGVAFPRMH
ncbi:MAG: hypothetical protein VB060_12640 [Oscillibacter sp.]|nr:hypothetical protein [Oscillibacter sp.]MEA4994643.1 hypothetical protein [Oscillibacter sp.]MEA5143090.1 hypothetical protein [Oscillibacter sp.]